MNAQERYNAARRAALDGKHAYALQEYIWFHHHALEEMPELAAVRLSFALGAWRDLAEVYPPALRALEQIRDQKADELLSGSTSWKVFHDVTSINETLGTMSLTYTLFVNLFERSPAFAKRCASIALPAIIDAGDFRLAKQVAPPPEPAILRFATQMNREELRPRSSNPALRRWADVRGFVEQVQLHMAIATGNGEHAEAANLKALALNFILPPGLRAAIESEFISPAEAPPPGAIDRSHEASGPLVS